MKLIILFQLISAISLAETTLSQALPPRDEVLYQITKATLKNKGDFVTKNAKRLGDKTIAIDTYASIEGNFELASRILSRIDRFPEWLLVNINRSPDGKTYFMRINGLTVTGNDPYVLEMAYGITLPAYQRTASRRFEMSFQSGRGFIRLITNALMNPDESVIEKTEGKLTVFPAEGDANRLWVAINGQVKVKPWLLYEALPEKLLKNEAGERMQIVMDNYLKEEDRWRTQPNYPARERALSADKPDTGPPPKAKK